MKLSLHLKQVLYLHHTFYILGKVQWRTYGMKLMIYYTHTYIILFYNMFWPENILKLLYSCFPFLNSDLIYNINQRSKLLLHTYNGIYETYTFNRSYCIFHEYTKSKQLHKMLRVLKIINCCKFLGTLKQVLLQNERHPQFSLLSAAMLVT